jgi:uncharacterized repeat protein (TIGR01451 family)
MRTNSMFSRLGAMLIACALLLVVAGETASAAGTTAGTQITSNASATYHDQVGGGSYNASATALSIYVAYKSVSTITVNTAGQKSVDGGYVVYSLTIANTGNYSDAYAVEFNTSDAKIQAINYYSNAGLTTELGGTAKNIVTSAIAADGNTIVYAKVSIKADASYPSYDNTTIVGTFRSRSTRNEVDADSLIKDLSTGLVTIPVGTGYLNKTFDASSATITTIVEAIFALTATPQNGTVRPGANLPYTISYNNSGHENVSNLHITVAFPANMTFSSSTNWTDNLNGTATYQNIVSVSPSSGNVDIADALVLTLSNSATNVEGNSTLTGSFSFSYTDNETNGLSRTRLNSSTFNTALYAFKAFATTRFVNAAGDTAISAQAGDSVTIYWQITNNSNGTDAYVIGYPNASEGIWGFNYYRDNSQHNLDNGGYPAVQYFTTPNIAQNGTATLYIRTKVPSGLTTSLIKLSFTIRSVRDSATVSNEYVGGRVTPLLPIIVVERARVINPADSVGSGANVSVVPGGTVTYWIYVRNTGTGNASTVVITDNVSATGGYTNAPTDATINNGIDHTFAIPGGSAGTYGSVAISGSGVVITINTLAAGESRIIHYATTVQ